VWVVLAVWVVLVGPAASAASAVSVASVELAAVAVLAVTVLRLYLPEAKMASAIGDTTRNIVAALLIRTARPQIALGAQRAEIPLPGARPVPGNRLPGRVETLPASLPRPLQVLATAADPALSVALPALVLAAVQADPIA
jgi:hypothetical protein